MCFMAKQAGPFFIEGTLDDLTFYKMEGKYYVRMKSSVTGKKFWKHKAFERSRESCERFSEGNRLASRLYRRIEKEKRKYKLFCFLKKKAIQLLKEGKSLTKAEEILMDDLSGFGMMEKRAVGKTKSAKVNLDNYPIDQFLVSFCTNRKQILNAKSLQHKLMQRTIYACAAGPPKVMGI